MGRSGQTLPFVGKTSFVAGTYMADATLKGALIMAEYRPKGCPLLLQSDTEPSMTVQGRSYTRSYFLPCIGHKCAAFKRDGASRICERFGTSTHIRIPDELEEGENKP